MLSNPNSIHVSPIVSVMAFITKEASLESSYYLDFKVVLYLCKKMFLFVGNPKVSKSDEKSFWQHTL